MSNPIAAAKAAASVNEPAASSVLVDAQAVQATSAPAVEKTPAQKSAETKAKFAAEKAAAEVKAAEAATAAAKVKAEAVKKSQAGKTQIHNRGTRVHLLEGGIKCMPGRAITVSTRLATRLVKEYSDLILYSDLLQSENAEAAVSLAASLEAENEALKAKLAALEAKA